MRILANENFPLCAVEAMRGMGHDVRWVRESLRGATDESLLKLAVTESRVLVTFDKDFGELAFKSKLPATCGIVLFRIRKQKPEVLAQRIAAFFQSRSDWAGHFAVVEDDRIRMTALPGSDPDTAGKISPTQ